jgi:hypothetical protein
MMNVDPNSSYCVLKYNLFVQERIPEEVSNVKNFENLSKEMVILMKSENFSQDVLTLMYQNISDANWKVISEVNFNLFELQCPPLIVNTDNVIIWIM